MPKKSDPFDLKTAKEILNHNYEHIQPEVQYAHDIMPEINRLFLNLSTKFLTNELTLGPQTAATYKQSYCFLDLRKNMISSITLNELGLKLSELKPLKKQIIFHLLRNSFNEKFIQDYEHTPFDLSQISTLEYPKIDITTNSKDVDYTQIKINYPLEYLCCAANTVIQNDQPTNFLFWILGNGFKFVDLIPNGPFLRVYF